MHNFGLFDEVKDSNDDVICPQTCDHDAEQDGVANYEIWYNVIGHSCLMNFYAFEHLRSWLVSLWLDQLEYVPRPKFSLSWIVAIRKIFIASHFELH